VEKTLENAKRVTGERYLGDDPKTNKPIYAKMGKYGPMVQKGSTEDDEKPKFAKMRPDQHIATITLEEAQELFKLPRKVGEFEGEEVIASEGRYGPYVRHKGKFYSLKDIHPLDVNIDQAIEVIKEKREADKKKNIKTFEKEEIEVLNGRYGPYIKSKGKNYKIPKDKKPEELTLEECKEIIEKAPAKKKKGRGRGKGKGKVK
jgi:DNA topoisomerase-1